MDRLAFHRRLPVHGLRLRRDCAVVFLFAGCARSPIPGKGAADSGRAQPPSTATAAIPTVFTDTAMFRRMCEVPDSGPPDYSKCILKFQGREPPRRTPPVLTP